MINGLKKTICVDFDGTIFTEVGKYPDIGVPYEGVAEALRELSKDYKIRIYTCRMAGYNANEWHNTKTLLEGKLREYDIPFDDIVLWNEGKPYAEYYIDNRAIEFKGDWKDVLNKLKCNKEDNMNIKTLWQGKWISVVSPVDSPYEAIHEKDIVIVIPIITRNKLRHVGIRYEHCPPYFIKDENEQNYYTVISGKIEDGENAEQTAVRELQEESGVIALEYECEIIADKIPICKSTDMRATICKLNIKRCNLENPKGDGTVNEEKSKTIWIPENKWNEINQIQNKDFLLMSVLNMIK